MLTAIVPPPDAAPARRLAIAGTLTENLLMPLMEKRLGFVGEVYAQGPAKRLKRGARAPRSAARRSSRWRVVGTAVRRRSAVPRRRPVSCACGGPSSRRGLGRRAIRSTRSLPCASASTGVPRAEGAIGEFGVGLAPVEGRGRRWEGHLVDVDGVAAGVDPEVSVAPCAGGPVGVSLDLEDAKPTGSPQADEPNRPYISTAPSRRSTKSITCAPCEYQPMKIRFWPGICWKTWAVQVVASTPVRGVAR